MTITLVDVVIVLAICFFFGFGALIWLAGIGVVGYVLYAAWKMSK